MYNCPARLVRLVVPKKNGVFGLNILIFILASQMLCVLTEISELSTGAARETNGLSFTMTKCFGPKFCRNADKGQLIQRSSVSSDLLRRSFWNLRTLHKIK